MQFIELFNVHNLFDFTLFYELKRMDINMLILHVKLRARRVDNTAGRNLNPSMLT